MQRQQMHEQAEAVMVGNEETVGLHMPVAPLGQQLTPQLQRTACRGRQVTGKMI